MSGFRIAVLVENNSCRTDIENEHGLAVYVESDSTRGLFDTGASGMLLKNADTLGIDLSRLDWIALSHGHYDHTGGLLQVLDVASGATLYAHEAAFEPRFHTYEDAPARDIGIPHLREKIYTKAYKVKLMTGTEALAPGVTLTGEPPRVTVFETIPEYFQVKDPAAPDGYSQDTFPDDQALLLTVNGGSLLLLGCAHSGAVNTLLHARELPGAGHVNAVMGGMHLSKSAAGRITWTVAEYHKLAVEKVAPNHCSGENAQEAFRNEYGDSFFVASAGRIFCYDGKSLKCK